MNHTPCPECNFIQWRISCAYIQRDWEDVHYWQNKRVEHQADCVIINGGWFKLLWPGAQVARMEEKRKAKGLE